MIDLNCASFLFNLEEYVDVFTIDIIEVNTEIKQKLPEDAENNESNGINNLLGKQSEVTESAEMVKMDRLVVDFKDGKSENFDIIYKHYLPQINNWARKSTTGDWEDLVGEVMSLVLPSSIKSWKYGFGTRFNTYFWKCIKNHFNCVKTRENAVKRQSNKNSMSMDKCHGNDEDDGATLHSLVSGSNDIVDNGNGLKLAIMSMKNMPEREKKILSMYLDKYTLDEIGEHFGITAAAVKMLMGRMADKTYGKQLKEILLAC